MWIGQRSDRNCGAAGKKKLITDRQRVLKGDPADQFAGLSRVGCWQRRQSRNWVECTASFSSAHLRKFGQGSKRMCVDSMDTGPINTISHPAKGRRCTGAGIGTCTGSGITLRRRLKNAGSNMRAGCTSFRLSTARSCGAASGAFNKPLHRRRYQLRRRADRARRPSHSQRKGPDGTISPQIAC